MTSNRFFIAKASVQVSGVDLEGREHRHLTRVARIKSGERVLRAASAANLMWNR